MNKSVSLNDEKESFGQELQNLRIAANVSISKLSDELSISRYMITKWETDQGNLPDRATVLQISRVLHISPDESSKLLHFLGEDGPTEKELRLFFDSGNENRLTSDTVSNEIRSIETHVADIETLMGLGNDVSKEIAQKEVMKSLRLIEQNTKSMNIPVRFPPPQDLAIDLIPSTKVYQLEELHNTESNIWVATSLLSSIITGIFVNWITGDQISLAALIVLLIAFLALIPAVYVFYKTKKRIKVLRSQILGSKHTKK